MAAKLIGQSELLLRKAYGQVERLQCRYVVSTSRIDPVPVRTQGNQAGLQQGLVGEVEAAFETDSIRPGIREPIGYTPQVPADLFAIARFALQAASDEVIE